MCEEHSVLSIVKLAKEQEQQDPESSAKSYLEAASSLLELSTQKPKKEAEFVELANKLYLKAKKLRSNKVLEFAPTKNSTGFASIGGLEDLKDEIKLKIIEPLKNPDLFQYYGKPLGGGILMYGPPGCGKSLIARATAHEAKTNFIHVKCSDLKSKYVGETEKNIADLFRNAREKQPSIIFFDEFESLGSDRSESLSHERSAVSQLLTEMDGMDSKDQNILLLAATNEPWSIDPALRREGRFGTTIFIPPPDLESRKQILGLHLKNKPLEHVNIEELAKMTEGFSGADLKAVCEKATDIPLKEYLKGGKKRKITMQDLRKAIDQNQSVLQQWFSLARSQVSKKKLEDFFKELIEYKVSFATVNS